MAETPYSLYLHIPFCRQRCAYCDFNTYAGLEAWHAAYVDALEAEIRYLGRQAGRRLPVHTVYFGGGTPSLLPPGAYERLLTAIADAFHLLPGAEISLEANPGTVDRVTLAGLRAAGVNRLSLGMQSARPEELRLLGREHDLPAVIHAVAAARAAGFDNLNLDLMYGLPGQTLAHWQFSLEWALRLAPEHLSLYALTLEHGTPMRAWVRRGLVPPPDDDAAADMYEWAAARLQAAGFVQYELSNWALGGTGAVARAAASDQPPPLPRYACRHNVQYWRSEPYLGLGAGAHGWAAGYRTVNVRAPQAYIARLRAGLARPPAHPFPWTPATVQLRRLPQDEALSEYMLMALRLTREGARWDEVRRCFGVEPEAVFASALARCQDAGLLERVPWGARVTPRGRLLANWVFRAFVGIGR